jgi:hypothetical protein
MVNLTLNGAPSFDSRWVRPYILSHCGDTVVLTGHPDGAIESLDAVYELKTVASSTYQMIVSNDQPIAEHYEQAMMYADALQKKNVLIHYFNKDSADWCWFLCTFNEAVVKALKAKMVQRFHNAATGTIEARPYHDPTSYPCKFCSFSDECYKDFESQVNEYQTTVIKPTDGLAQGIIECAQTRQARLSADKIEKTLKKDIADAMHVAGMKVIQVEGTNHIAKLKLGKYSNPLVEVK